MYFLKKDHEKDENDLPILEWPPGPDAKKTPNELKNEQVASDDDLPILEWPPGPPAAQKKPLMEVNRIITKKKKVKFAPRK